MAEGDTLACPDIRAALEEGQDVVIATFGEKSLELKMDLSLRERECVLAGRVLYLKKKG